MYIQLSNAWQAHPLTSTLASGLGLTLNGLNLLLNSKDDKTVPILPNLREQGGVAVSQSGIQCVTLVTSCLNVTWT